MGRAPQQFATGRDIYQQLAAAEPHATEARKEELRTLARAQARHVVPFWDVQLHGAQPGAEQGSHVG